MKKTIKVGKVTPPAPHSSVMIPTTWKGWESKGKVGYDQLTALKEIINNVVQDTKLVNIQIVIDTGIGMMWATDDMCGIESDLLPGIYFSGQSYENGTLLSEHGDGLAITTNWWGNLQFTKTSIDGNDFDEVRLDRSQPHASLKQIYNVNPIQKYSVDSREWVNTDVPGFQTKIRLHNPPKYSTWFDNLVTGLNSAYWEYLGKHLNIEIVWLKSGKFHSHFNCQPTKMLLTKNPDHGVIDKARMLGLNEWDCDEIYRCNKTGIVVDLKIGNVPDPGAVLTHYGQDVYDEYIKSSYCHRGDMVGVHYSKSWVPIADSRFKGTSHAESLLGFINIRSGIDTVQTKNGIVRPTDGTMEIFEEELTNKIFKPRGFKVRAQKTYHKISEYNMEKNVLNLLQKDSTIRSIMGFNDKNVFDKKHTSVNGGVPDINAYVDKTKVDQSAIIEIKKEGGDRLWKAIVQGCAYCEGTESPRLIIVAQDKELSQQMWSKIRPLERWARLKIKDFSVDYFQYQYLVMMAKSSKD